MNMLPVLCCGPETPALDIGEAEALAARFKALADPARVRAVNLLATSGDAVCICDLMEPLGLSQATVSHHMKKLLDAGLVERETRGRWSFYSLKRDAVEKLVGVVDLRGACC